MTSWMEHAVRRWRLKQRAGELRKFQHRYVGTLPLDKQLQLAFQDMIKMNPIRYVVGAILEAREWWEEVKG